MTDDLSRLETAILRAATDATAWPDVMTAFVEGFPGARANLQGFDTELARSLPATQAGYDDDYVAAYYQHFHRLNPYVPGWVTLPVGHVIHSTDLVPEATLLGTEFYHDWVRPQRDIRHSLGGVLARDPGRLFLFSCHIEHGAADRLTAPLMRALARLQPLLRHALDVNRMMLGLRLDAEALRHGIEPSGAALLLLTADGTILHANRRAEAMLAEGEVLRHDAFGRLRLAGATERLAGALRLPPRSAPLSFRLSGIGMGHVVRVVPLRPDSVADVKVPLLLGRNPAALVVIRSDRSPPDDVALTMRGLGVTRAEAEVIVALADGAVVAEVAKTRDVSVQTVRNQVKSALGKTGSRRQADLVRAVAALRQRRA